MASCISHTQCPECAKLGKDRGHNNLANYSDGSSYCFSCSYFITGTHAFFSKEKPSKTESISIVLPRDSTTELPDVAYEFLKKYNITVTDIQNNSILWSPLCERIFFPILDSDNSLLAYQGRYLGTDTKKPKWYSQGDLKNICHILGNRKAPTLIVTEDIISAIKVSHDTKVKTMPLFGSHISIAKLLQIKPLCDILVVWLDKDKEKESIKFVNIANKIGLKALSIITEKDPKEYTDEEITQWLYKYLKFC